MKKQLLTLLLLSTAWMLQAQNPGGVATGLQIWLKGNAGLTPGGLAPGAQWTDQSTNANHAIVRSSDVQGMDFNANNLNYNPSLEHRDGMGNWLSFNTTLSTKSIF